MISIHLFVIVSAFNKMNFRLCIFVVAMSAHRRSAGRFPTTLPPDRSRAPSGNGF